MIIELFVTIVSALVGSISGIIPGIHPNLVASVIFSSKDALAVIIPEKNLAIGIIVLTFANSVTNFVASCYFGVPESDNCATVLPGHRYLLRGKAHEAVMITVISSILSLLSLIAVTPILIWITPIIYENIKKFIGYILILCVLYFIVNEKKSKVLAMVVFTLSGILGMIVLNMNNLREPLLPLLSGLFGVPALLMSLKKQENMPRQEISFPQLEKNDLFKTQASSILTGYMFSVIPSLGPSQAAIIGSKVSKLSTRGFLMLSGSLGTVNMFMSLITAYTLGKARNGSVAVASEILAINKETLIVIIGSLLVAVPVITVCSIMSSKILIKLINKIDYRILSIGVLIMITIIVSVITRWMGLFVLCVATSTGLVAYLSDMQKNHLMGALILPTIIFFLG